MLLRSLPAWRRVISCAILCLLAAGCGEDGAPTAPTGPTSPAGPVAPGGGGTSGAVLLTEDFGGRQLFPSDNWWNQDISTAPVDPQSDAYIAFIGRTRTAHPDFGPPPYGIPYVGVGAAHARTP